jgi:hypothetical protein
MKKLKNFLKAPRSYIRKKELEYVGFKQAREFSSGEGYDYERDDSFLAFVYDTTNLGDEIQTIAQVGVMPEESNPKLINRDDLSSYEGRKRKCIMNGWFTHRPSKWPPSEEIEPIFVSFHISRDEIAAKKYQEYYKKYEPIGCRDKATVEKLENIGVKAEFTGCLTLTLENPYQEEEREGHIVVTDSHINNNKSYPPSAPKIFEKVVPKKIKEEAIYLKHEVSEKYKNKYKGKINKAVKLLNIYANSKLVITSRLHCALPCLAMGIPVVFLHRKWNTDERFDGYREILNGHGPSATKANINWQNPNRPQLDKEKSRLKKFINKKLNNFSGN